MGKFRRAAQAAVAVTGLVVAGALVVPPTAVAAKGDPPSAVRVIARGLDGPFGLDSHGRGFVVAETATGKVTKIDRRGRQRVLVPDAPGVAGVAAGRHRVFSVLGGPNEEGEPAAGAFPPSSVLRTNLRTMRTVAIADLLAYELKNNPDGQVQFVDGKPVETLSNPFAVTKYGRGLLVADGGANAVLRVNPRTGKVRTFFVPPTVKDVPACLEDGAQANPGTEGCDPVPTGVTVAHGSVYVSTLGAEVPGAGRVYKLNRKTGRVQRVWKGLTAPTGIAVGRDRSIYVSQVLEGAPEGDGPPPPGFDPAEVGQITRIARSGRRSEAQVTMPVGLLVRGGHLYSTAWSIAFFLGINDAGQVVEVKRRAFR